MYALFSIRDKEGEVVMYTSEVIRENAKTVLVRAPDGRIVKRHKVKHSVQEVGSRNETMVE